MIGFVQLQIPQMNTKQKAMRQKTMQTTRSGWKTAHNICAMLKTDAVNGDWTLLCTRIKLLLITISIATKEKKQQNYRHTITVCIVANWFSKLVADDPAKQFQDYHWKKSFVCIFVVFRRRHLQCMPLLKSLHLKWKIVKWRTTKKIEKENKALKLPTFH